ncbi:YaaC family protein [Bacillus sp. FJAT-49711]|uniref:YaaC family protein n=1 Tax=Bacillus sp. FJAT-49711 TaxID=2833585 RepID=UPI001BC973FB|nr:YaaC family protein [Bacillus sp. FJAT-49711]MBS4221144.1 YaaC family protein [Bacillus sp. FJAT-49711]
MHIEDDVWKRFTVYQSAETTQHFLKKCYKEIENKDIETKSYDNCFAFMYYLEQGEVFYKQASLSPLSIRPILLFYGLIHLIKACLLTVDPFYPNSTSVLAHGVTTRKRKKRHYKFLHDEIKVQKNGLCTFFSEQLFHVKHLEGEKFHMIDLLKLVVELDDVMLHILRQPNMIALERMDDNKWGIPKEIYDSYYMDGKRLKEYLNGKYSEVIIWEEEKLKLPAFQKQGMISPPFRYHIFNQNLYIPAEKYSNMELPDMIVHYLLLYNLSMISRYETEWWIDLIKTTPNSDYPIIKSFLEITEKKGPLIVEEYLRKKLL